VRGLSADPHASARRASVVGIAAFVNVPIVHYSVVWWRTLHQPPTVLRPGGPADAMDPMMLTALLTSVLTFTLGAAWVHVRRVAALATADATAAADPRPPGDAGTPAAAGLTVTARRTR
jgi:heme exporter protein C